MAVFIITQRDSFFQALSGALDWSMFDAEGAFRAASIQEVLEARSTPRGSFLLWDCENPEDPAELHCRMHDARRVHALLLFSREESVPMLHKALEAEAVDVVEGMPEREALEGILRRAADQLYEKRIHHMKIKTFRQLRFAAVGGVMRGMLMHSPNAVDLEMMQELGMIPCGSRPGWLVMIHITNRAAHPEMERTMFSVAIGNIAGEVFQPIREMHTMSWMGDDLFALFLQNTEGEEPPRQVIEEHLQLIRHYLSQYLDWQVNMYVTELKKVADAPGEWEVLERGRRENVSLYPGVFFREDRRAEPAVDEAAGVQDLRRFLVDGYAELIEQESSRYLMQLMNSGRGGRKTLRNFYQEYLKLVYSVMWEKGWDASKLFRTEKELEILNNAPNTVETMETFLHHVSEYFRACYAERNTKTAVQLVCQYISDHYAEPLSREDLAEYIHLNPDYLTRIFRKETGSSLKDYIVRKRMEAARMLLRNTDMRISEIAEMVGYGNYSYFTQNYRKEFGLTPKQEREQHAPDDMNWQ